MASRQLFNMGSESELRQFLKAIHEEFLQTVDPLSSGLMDTLQAADLTTDTDQESLSGKHVRYRKDQARKVWILLNKMPVASFMQTVAPKLVKDYSHIIPDRFLQERGSEPAVYTATEETQKCLHHDITQRIRPISLADLLYQHDCFTFQQYESLETELQAGNPEQIWKRLLTAMSCLPASSSTQLARKLQTVLLHHKLTVPGDLPQLVSSGIPCTCSTNGEMPFLVIQAEALPTPPQRKVYDWMTKSPFGSSSVRSSGSSTGPRSTSSQTVSQHTASVDTHTPRSSLLYAVPYQPSHMSLTHGSNFQQVSYQHAANGGNVMITMPAPMPVAKDLPHKDGNANILDSMSASETVSERCCNLPCVRQSYSLYQSTSANHESLLKFLSTHGFSLLLIVVLAIITGVCMHHFFISVTPATVLDSEQKWSQVLYEVRAIKDLLFNKTQVNASKIRDEDL